MTAKCVVVGASQVGKTAIVRLLCEGKATPRYQRTVGISAAHKEIELADRAPAEQPARVQLHVWDKAAESNFATLDEVRAFQRLMSMRPFGRQFTQGILT